MLNEQNGGVIPRKKDSRAFNLTSMSKALDEILQIESPASALLAEKAFKPANSKISKPRSRKDKEMKGTKEASRKSLRIQISNTTQQEKLPVAVQQKPKPKPKPELSNVQLDSLYLFLKTNKDFTIDENKEHEFRKDFYNKMGIKQENKLGKVLGFLVQYLVQEKLIDESKLTQFYENYNKKRNARASAYVSDSKALQPMSTISEEMIDGGRKKGKGKK